MPTDTVVEGLERRDTGALARAISLVENHRPGFERVLAHVHPLVGLRDARRIGITGPPGAGKSTLTGQLIRRYREAGLTVAVIAVDPTSPFTGGALLGDRIRMEAVSLDPGVFIRSMATRGSQGGLAVTTDEVADVLEAFGFDRILIETVGVGQTELDVAGTADTTVLVLVPESGDGIQTLKAGVMEAADVFVLNKSDRPGADRLRQELEVMLGLRRGSAFRHITPHHHPTASRTDGHGKRRTGADKTDKADRTEASRWEPPVLATVASQGEGVSELTTALDRHRAFLVASGGLVERRRRRLADRARAVVERAVRQWVWEETPAADLLAQRLDDVTQGRRSPYDVAAEILEQIRTGVMR